MRYKGTKGKAWEEVKKAVRRNESDCYTCHRKDLIANGIKADSGHYFPVGHQGSNNKLSWHPRLIHLQCSRCNGAGQGMQNEYRTHLVKDYGEAFVLHVESTRYLTAPVKNWQEVIDTFKELSTPHS